MDAARILWFLADVCGSIGEKYQRDFVMKIILILSSALCAITAHADPICYPKEAGGTGTHFRSSAPKNGKLYTWWCGNTPEWIGITQEQDKGALLIGDKEALKAEINRLRVLQGYARAPDTFKAEAEKQLGSARPGPKL